MTTLSDKREFSKELARQIKDRKQSLAAPKNDVIPFRNDKENNTVREIFKVPIELLYFRHDNNRINAKMKTFTKQNPQYDDENKYTSSDFQEILAKKLFDQDVKKHKVLKDLILAQGQDKYAIATADGFLIDGNRRKAVMQELFKETGQDKFGWMKVILLPDGEQEGDGGRPTRQEIRTLERILQISRDGRSSYSNLNRALSMKEEIELMNGNVESYIKADPGNANIIKQSRKLKSYIDDLDKEFLGPIKLIDDYLEYLEREDEYTIIEDKGLWDAFRDFYKSVLRNIKKDDNHTPEDYSDLVQIGFKMISTRNFSRDIRHEMTDLKKYWKDETQKKQISYIKKVDDPELLEDKSEAEKARGSIVKIVQKTRDIKAVIDSIDKPLELIEGAVAKMEKVKSEDIVTDYDDILDNLRLLNNLSNNLESEIYHKQKESKQKTNDWIKESGKPKQKKRKK